MNYYPLMYCTFLKIFIVTNKDPFISTSLHIAKPTQSEEWLKHQDPLGGANLTCPTNSMYVKDSPRTFFFTDLEIYTPQGGGIYK